MPDNLFHGGIRLKDGGPLHRISLTLDDRAETIRDDVEDTSWTLVPAPFNVASEDGPSLPTEIAAFLSQQSAAIILDAGGFVDVDWYESVEDTWAMLTVEVTKPIH